MDSRFKMTVTCLRKTLSYNDNIQGTTTRENNHFQHKCGISKLVNKLQMQTPLSV